jgi:hypothetical protein
VTEATKETEREYAWRVYDHDVLEIPDPKDAPSTRCRQPLCGAPVYWALTAANKRRSCFDIKPTGERTGTNHFRTCRQRPERSAKPKGDAAV